MVIKLYISGISGNKEVKKKQQRVQMILDSKQIDYEAIDITEPGKEKDKEFMQQNGKVRESLGKHPLPPQIFNDEDFCGDYEDFDMANEVDELEKFLHMETISKDNESDAKDIDLNLIKDILATPSEDELKSMCEKFKSKKQPSSNLNNNPYEYQTYKIYFNGVNGLKEPIINTNDLTGEIDQTEEVIKSEVNGESEVTPSLEPSSENITKNDESSNEEVIAQEKEESSTQEIKANDETNEEEKEGEENVEDKEEHEDEGEAEDKKEEEEKEDVENPKEETVESPNKENSPSLEEKETDNKEEEEEEEEEKEKESEKEENESDDESPQSEKSQE